MLDGIGAMLGGGDDDDSDDDDGGDDDAEATSTSRCSNMNDFKSRSECEVKCGVYGQLVTSKTL